MMPHLLMKPVIGMGDFTSLALPTNRLMIAQRGGASVTAAISIRCAAGRCVLYPASGERLRLVKAAGFDQKR
jgi:hypothetical protein